MELKSYLDKLAVGEREAFAKRCGTTAGHLRNISYGYKPCGEGLAINIERESEGAVTCEETRPDVDWGYLRGTAAKRERRAPLRSRVN